MLKILPLTLRGTQGAKANLRTIVSYFLCFLGTKLSKNPSPRAYGPKIPSLPHFPSHYSGEGSQNHWCGHLPRIPGGGGRMPGGGMPIGVPRPGGIPIGGPIGGLIPGGGPIMPAGEKAQEYCLSEKVARNRQSHPQSRDRWTTPTTPSKVACEPKSWGFQQPSLVSSTVSPPGWISE